MSHRIDLTGDRFGSWTVLHFSHTGVKGQAYWECRCDCGTQVPVLGSNLRQGVSTRCVTCANTAKYKDCTGQRFGAWTVLERAHRDRRGNWRWLCRCDCGTEKTVLYPNLVRGLSTRCRACANRNRKEGKK